MKQIVHLFIWLFSIVLCFAVDIILNLILAAFFSFRLGYLFHLLAIWLCIKLAKSLIAKFDAYYDSKKSGISSEIISTCEYYEGEDKRLASYLDSCLKANQITQEQRDMLFNKYRYEYIPDDKFQL